MKKYVFLANTLTGISGGTIYVRNKKKNLEDNGWEVIVFDNAIKSGTILPDLDKYKKNRIYELSFIPSWYNKRERNKIVKKIIDIICPSGEGVIESDQLSLAGWGEIIAKALNWKHLIYDINEKDIITNKKDFCFFYEKLTNKQLFFISEKACVNAFSKYTHIKDASLHHWNAGVYNDILDVRINIIDQIEKATYNIGYFGRYKSFIPYVVKQVSLFSQHHSTSAVNFIVLGFTEFTPQEEAELDQPNLKVKCVEAQPVIPESFFEKTDVVIATAGCASIAYRHGALVISMNVETERPIGIMGYTTSSSTYSTDNSIIEHKSLNDLIDYCFTNKETIAKTVRTKVSSEKIVSNPYNTQLKYIAHNFTYYNVLRIYSADSFPRLLQLILVKLGGAFFLFKIKKNSY